jgi:phosphate transport system permease protein
MNRAVINLFFGGISKALGWIALLLLIFLIGTILFKGAGAVNLEFLTMGSRNFGAQGGILYQIIGSIIMIAVAGILCLPLALGTAIAQTAFIKTQRIKNGISMLVFGLNSVPSIIFGIFGLIFFVNILNTGISWLVGSFILAIMMIPTVVVTAFQSMDSIPIVYRESALSLGMTRWQMVRSVLIPQGFSGALTGLLVALARAVGETAPIMFIATAFSGVTLPTSVNEPVATLPTHILILAQNAVNPDALQSAWGSSLVLMILVLTFSISGLFARLSLRKVSQR